MLSACTANGWHRCVVSWFWLAHKPIVLRVKGWFDGKHFFIRKPYEVDCRITVPLQQLLAASQMGDAIGLRQFLHTTSFDTLELKIAINYSVHSQSMNASFVWDLRNRSVCFWIIFLTEDKVFDILNVLDNTHRTVCRCPVANQSYPPFRFSLTECRYFHILSTCYEPVWQTLGLKELMCK